MSFKKIGVFIIMLSLIIPAGLSYSTISGPPETLEEAQEHFLRFPGYLEGPWQDAKQFLLNTFNKIFSFITSWLKQRISIFWNRIINYFKELFDQKTEILKEEIEREKEELQETVIGGVKDTGKSLWQRIIDKIRSSD